MSYLNLPRFSFLGNIYANASTATNNDIADVFDVDNITFKNQMTLMQGGQTLPPPNNPQAPAPPNQFNWNSANDNSDLRKWLMGEMEAPGLSEDPVNPCDPKTEGRAQMAHWNYYGDHNTEFRKTKITGIQLPGGPAPKSDTAYGLHVELLGDIFYQMRRGAVLVDVDPCALVTSQIFSGQFKLSYRGFGAGQSFPVLIADHPTPAYSYYINPHKNVNPSTTGFEMVSAIFQFAIPNENLCFNLSEPENNFRSPALQALQQQAAQGQGLMVRFCLYDAIFNIESTTLATEFANGNYVNNPYLGMVIGSLGVWNNNELASAPPGRKFKYQFPYTYNVPQAEHSAEVYAEKRKKAASLAKYRGRSLKTPCPSEQPATKQATLGQTLAVIDQTRKVISLDCVSTFPEQNIQLRDKLNLGPMNLSLLYGDPNEQTQLPSQSLLIGTITYDMYAKAAYESGGGIIDLDYSGNSNIASIESNLTSGMLAIGAATPPAGDPLYYLIETPYLDVQTDDRAAYFDCKVISNGQVINGTTTITIQVTQNGVAPTSKVPLNLEYWMCQKDFINPDKWQVPVTDRYFSVEGATQIANTTYPMVFAGNQTKASVITDQIMVPEGGQLTLTLTALRPGVSMIRFVDPSPAKYPLLASPPIPNFGWDNVDYAVIRILPFDDFSSKSDEEINNWPFIYENVLGFYSVMYPVMSKIIPWGPDGAPNNPQEVKAFASNILNFTDPDMWDTTIYMPITRDMSGGKRELLRRWCNLQQ